ncbi:MAG: tRNA epoxyqueuosine(34) reductase QueG [Chlamydiia bacterium]|nr:tRNA epoxyqueuosine(34) reductase QueG [Chlamydiia bacterium]
MISEEDITQKASELGYDDVGITQAQVPEEDITAYRDWLSKGYHGDLHYMEKEIRCTPDVLLPGAKTAIIFVSYYKQPKVPFVPGKGVIASYARGRDYHNVHRSRLKKFIRWLEETSGQMGIAKGFSDSTPILEKALAVQAGLGWFGKNTLLIHRRFGTFTLLSGCLTTLEFSHAITPAHLPRCGSCTRCLDACPTKALIAPYTLDAAKCLSNHLIESKAPLPKTVKAQNPGYAFGCDICQDVCPHNTRKPLSTTPDFSPDQGFGPYLTPETLTSLEEDPTKLHGTPLKRRGLPGLKLNLTGTEFSSSLSDET